MEDGWGLGIGQVVAPQVQEGDERFDLAGGFVGEVDDFLLALLAYDGERQGRGIPLGGTYLERADASLFKPFRARCNDDAVDLPFSPLASECEIGELLFESLSLFACVSNELSEHGEVRNPLVQPAAQRLELRLLEFRQSLIEELIVSLVPEVHRDGVTCP